MINKTWLRKIRRDILARKTRTALVSTSVFVGVLGVVVMTMMGQLLTRQLEKNLLTSELAMLRIYVKAPERLDDEENEAYLERLRAMPGVETVEGEAVYQINWKLPNQTDFQKGDIFAYSEPFPLIRIEPPRTVEGRLPIAGHDEIAIEQRMADKYGIKLRDTLLVQNRFGREIPMTIVGFVFQPYIYFGVEGAGSNIFATYSDAQRLLGFNGYSSIYVRFNSFSEALQQSSRFRSTLTRQTPYEIAFYLLDDPQENAFLVGIRRFNRVMLILAVVAMLVASFLVTNVITTIIAEQQRQIGAMKAIGAGQFDIFAIYLGMAFTYGLIGTIPAVLLGIPIGRRAAEITAPLANTILEDTSLPTLPVLMGLGLGLFVPVLAAIIPVYNGSKISIIQAMTDRGIQADYGKGLIPRLMKWLPLSLTVEQALNSVARRKGRLTMTMLSLALAAAAFMGMFSVFYILRNVIVDIRDTLDVPENIEVLNVVQGLLSDQREQIRTIEPGVAVEVGVESLPAETESQNEEASAATENGERIFVTGIDEETDLSNLTLIQGRFLGRNEREENTLVITPRMANRFEKAVGDTLQLTIQDHTDTFEIIGIAEFPIELAFTELETLRNFVGVVRDAPVPNNYWGTVQAETEENENPLNKQDIWAVGIDERAGRLLVTDYSAETPGVILSQQLADVGGYVKGEDITLKTEEETVTYPILDVVPVETTHLLMFGESVPAAVRSNPQMIALYWEELARLEALDYREITPTTYYLDLTDPRAFSAEAPRSFIPIPAHQNQLAFADSITQTILSIGLVMNLASLLMGLVGGIGLLTITSIGVFERQREIGVMRSVGASSRIIINQFLIEGMLVGFFAWLVAIPLSYFLSIVLINAVPFREVIKFEYTPLAPIIGMVGTFIVTLIATLYPSIQAARKTVAEILRYQ